MFHLQNGVDLILSAVITDIIQIKLFAIPFLFAIG